MEGNWSFAVFLRGSYQIENFKIGEIVIWMFYLKMVGFYTFEQNKLQR